MSGVSHHNFCETHQTWKQERWLQLKAADDKNRGQPEGFVSTNFAFSEAKWQLDGRSAAGVTACVAPAAGWRDGCPLDGERSNWCRGAKRRGLVA
jgi:hypothetical protein